MNKLKNAVRGIPQLITHNNLKQKIILIIILIIFAFVYVNVFAPPLTEEQNGFDSGDAAGSFQITDAAPYTASFAVAAGEPIGVTLHFNVPEYVSTDSYDLKIADSAGKVLLQTAISAGGLTEDGSLVAGLTNAPETAGDTYTISISGENITEQTALCIQTRGDSPYIVVKYALGISQNVAFGSFLLVLIMCVMILFYNKKLEINILVSAIAFGVFFAVLVPILDVPDELNHLGKAFSVSHFDLFDGGAQVSSSFNNMAGNWNSTFLNSSLSGVKADGSLMDMTYGTGQFFLGYIPQGLALGFARLFGADLLSAFYAGRILNLIAFAILAFFAIKTAPRYKLFFGIVAITPIVLFISASYNQDAITYGLALLLVAYFTKLYFDKSFNIGFKQIIIFTVLCALLSMVKYNLTPMCVLPFFLPKERFGNLKTKIKYALFAFGVPLVCALGVYAAVAYATSISAGADVSALTSDGVNIMGANIGQQLKFMISSIPTSVSIFLRAFVENGTAYINQLFTFGWLSYYIPVVFIYFYVGFVMLTAFVYSKYEYAASNEKLIQTPLRPINRFGIFVVICALFTLINLILYLTWTPVGADYIQGVQGRYLVPIMLLLPFLTRNVQPDISDSDVLKTRNTVLFVAQLFVMLSLLQTLFVYY